MKVFGTASRELLSEFNTPDARIVIVTLMRNPGVDTVVITVGTTTPVVVPIVQIRNTLLWGAAVATDAVGSATAILADS